MRGPQRLGGDDEFAPRQRQRRRRATRMKAGMLSTPRIRVRLRIDCPEIGGHGQREDQGRKGQQHVHAADHHRLDRPRK